MNTKRILISLLLMSSFLALSWPSAAFAGAVFVSGHDAIWHSNFGGNTAGATNLATTAIEFARDGSTLPFLFVESTSVPVPAGSAREAPFLTSRLGYATSDVVVADSAFLNSLEDFRTALDSYSAIVVASDFGGMLTAAELGFLNAHSSDIINYLNAGGGLAAFAESNEKGLIGGTPPYQFLPFLVSSVNFQTPEVANTVTAFGASLGLTDADVNGNFSHNFFSTTGRMIPVDLFSGDPNRPLSLAFEGPIGPGGVIPVPGAMAMGIFGIGLVGWLRRRLAL